MIQVLYIPWILRINLFKPRNPGITDPMTSKSWNNRPMTSKSWNNIKIFMLDHGL